MSSTRAIYTTVGYVWLADCKTSTLSEFFNYSARISSQCFQSHTWAERYILITKQKSH